MSDEIISKALGLPTLSSYDEDGNFIDDDKDEIEIEEIDSEDDLEITEALTGEIVDAEEIEETNIVPTNTESFVGDMEYIEDIDKAKKNVSKMIRDGHEAFENLILLATQTENPRAYEVASKLMNDLVNANKEMVNFSERKSNAKTLKNQVGGTTNNTTNNLVITSAELLKILKGKQE